MKISKTLLSPSFQRNMNQNIQSRLIIGNFLFLAKFLLPLLILLLAIANPIQAQSKARMIQDLAKVITTQGSRSASREAVEVMSRRIDNIAARYGDEGMLAIQKTGQRGLELLENAGAAAPKMVKLFADYGTKAVWIASKPKSMAIFIRHGDDAATAMMKYQNLAIDLISAHGKPAAMALNRLGPKNARRMAMLQQDGTWQKIGRTDELLENITKWGDTAMDFIWRHRGKLATAAVLSAFLANPEPYLNGVLELTDRVSGHTIKPLVEKVASSVNWNLWVPLGIGGFLWLIWYRRRSSLGNRSGQDD